MPVNAYLEFDGRCEEAFRFYERTLGGKIEAMLPFEGSPAAEQMPAGSRSKILHAMLRIGDSMLMGSDGAPGTYTRPQGFHVCAHFDTAEEAERAFRALAEGGTVTMPIAETFWALRYGMLVDRFGTPWMVNCSPSA